MCTSYGIKITLEMLTTVPQNLYITMYFFFLQTDHLNSYIYTCIYIWLIGKLNQLIGIAVP